MLISKYDLWHLKFHKVSRSGCSGHRCCLQSFGATCAPSTAACLSSQVPMRCIPASCIVTVTPHTVFCPIAIAAMHLLPSSRNLLNLRICQRAGSAVTADFAVVAAEMQQEAAAAAAAAAQAAAAAAAAAYERKKAKQRARRETLLKNAATAQSAAAHTQQPAMPAASPCGQNAAQQLPAVAGRGAGRGSRPRGRGRGAAQQQQHQHEQQQTSPGPPTLAATGRGRGRGRGGRCGASAASASGPTLASAHQQQAAQVRQPLARAAPQRPVPAAAPASSAASMPTQVASGAAPPQRPPSPDATMPTSPAGLQQPGGGATAAQLPTRLPSAALPARPHFTEGALLHQDSYEAHLTCVNRAYACPHTNRVS